VAAPGHGAACRVRHLGQHGAARRRGGGAAAPGGGAAEPTPRGAGAAHATGTGQRGGEPLASREGVSGLMLL